MSKQVISGDTHTQGHYDVIQNTICPTTTVTIPNDTTTDISERAVSTQLRYVTYAMQVVGLKIASTHEALSRRHN
jgi:hypothetical protein